MTGDTQMASTAVWLMVHNVEKIGSTRFCRLYALFGSEDIRCYRMTTCGHLETPHAMRKLYGGIK